MVILSDGDFVGGKPRMEGHRLWVSHVVGGVEEAGLVGYIRNYDIQQGVPKIREALEYCMNQSCEGQAIKYCQYCSKNTELSGVNMWEVARRLHEEYFGEFDIG